MGFRLEGLGGLRVRALVAAVVAMVSPGMIPGNSWQASSSAIF